MPLTLAGLARKPGLSLTVLAGADALSQSIRWVHASELADPTPYLDGGELLLSLGLWLDPDSVDDEELIEDYLDRLMKVGVVGLAFGVGVRYAEVPPAMVRAATQRGLPLLSVPERTAFIAISRTVWEALAADQHTELIRTSQAHQELTRAAIASGTHGLVRRLAERLDGWAMHLDPAGRVEHAAPPGAARKADWLAGELKRYRDVGTAVSATMSIDDDHIVVQSLRIEKRVRGFLAVGSPHRLTSEQRSVLSAGASLLTLMLAQTGAVRATHAHIRAMIFDLLVGGDLERASRLADDVVGALPAEPVRLLLVAGPARVREALTEAVAAAAAAAGDRVFHAPVGDRLAILCSARGSSRGRVLGAARCTGAIAIGESSDAAMAALGKAVTHADQALTASLCARRRYTAHADIAASGLLALLPTAQSAAFAESLLSPLIEHDATGRGDLLRSLSTWLEHNGEWDAAATALGVHRHTLRHRIARAQALIGRDLNAVGVRMELWASIQLLD